MKQTLFVFVLLALSAPMLGAMQGKAFDVRNGGASAWTVQFTDAAAKDKITDDICEAFDYAGATKSDPAPPTKNQFAMRQVQFLIAQTVREGRRKARDKNIQPVDEIDIP